MSHFSVAIFHHPWDNIDDMMEPYCETTDNPQYIEFQREKTREEILEYLKENGDSRTPDEYGDDYGYVYDEESDAYGYYSNPDAKWDYFTIGGRWDGMLRIKPKYRNNGDRLNSAPLAWVDTSPDPETYKRAIREWEIIVENMPLAEGEERAVSLVGAKYYLDQYKTKENYANSMAAFSTYAFVTPDGEWFETGNMGWWGIDNSSYESRKTYASTFVQTIEELRDDPNIWITILDCHI